ncbi:MAG TPA: flagellar biosynthetic protein FliO [Steroidobacteraceae bacterium]
MSASSFAAEQPFAAPKAAEPVPGADAGSLVQVTLSLLLVLGCVFAAAWLMRRLRNFGRPGAGAIEVVADLALGVKERAVLVQVGKQQILLGVAPGRVSTLHVLSEPVHVDQPGSFPSGEVPDGVTRPSFKSIFRRSLGL